MNTALQRINDPCNILHLYYEGKDRHIHMEIIIYMSNMSVDSLEQIRLILAAVTEIITMVQ